MILQIITRNYTHESHFYQNANNNNIIILNHNKNNYSTGPWAAIALTIGTGCAMSMWSSFVNAIKEDLPFQKQLYVNRRREKLLAEGGTYCLICGHARVQQLHTRIVLLQKLCN